MDWEPDHFDSPNASSNSARKEGGNDLNNDSADEQPENYAYPPPYAPVEADSNNPDLEDGTPIPIPMATPMARKKTATFALSPPLTPSPRPSATNPLPHATTTPRPAPGNSTPSSPPTPPPHHTLALFPPAVPYTLPRPRLPPTPLSHAAPNGRAAAFPQDHEISTPAGTSPGTGEAAAGGSTAPALRSTTTAKPKSWASRRTAPKQMYFRWECGVRIAGRVCGPRGEGGWGGRGW